MRPILFESTETAFDSNGIGVLTDTIECRVVEELNGIFELSMRYPTTGIHFKHLTTRAIILVKPNPVADPQPFRIYRRTPTSRGDVSIRARHIAYDLIGNVVSPFRAAGAAAALAALKGNSTTECPFSFWTDKTATSTMEVKKPSTVWSLLGGTKGSVLDCFGGEYEFDRFAVKLWTRRGSDQGVSIRYGKNLVSLEQDESCENCYTGIYPFWVSSDAEQATLVQLPEKVVNAPGKYGYTRILPVDFSMEWSEAPTEDALRARAQKYIDDNKIGVPTVSIKVKHIPLEQTAEYAGKILLERALLGDTVDVFFPALEVSASARVVATDFDVLQEVFVSTTVGSLKSNISATIAQQGKDNRQSVQTLEEKAPAGFGLGKSAWRSSLPDCMGGTGFFCITEGAEDAPFRIGDIVHIGRTSKISTQLAIDHLYGRPDLQIRKCASDGWGDWRHINPRMLLNTEYLTNEVWQNKDVYVKALSFETLASSGYAWVELGMNVTPITIHGIAYNSQYICDLSAFRDVDEVFYQTSNGRLMIHSTSAGAADYKAIVVVEYTKG